MMPKRIVAFVPIKLHSQRLAGKNVKPLGAVPLLRYILDVLVGARHIDDVYVFCSDESIVELLPPGVKFLKREKWLDSDETLGSEIYDSFIKKVSAEYYLLAHATSPYVKVETISRAIDKVMTGGFDSALTVKQVRNFVWFENRPLNYSLDNVPRTQDLEPVYVECSAFFIFRRDHWVERRRRVGETPYFVLLDGREAIDIDNQDDFSLAEFYLERS